MTSPTLEGGCQCGQVRYRVDGRPRQLYVCHCRDCQKQSGSAFGMSLIVNTPELVITDGSPRRWSTRADSGGLKVCWFCGNCGTRLFHGGDEGDATISIKAGSLDDTSTLQPSHQIWTSRAQSWVHIDHDRFGTSPAEPDD